MTEQPTALADDANPAAEPAPQILRTGQPCEVHNSHVPTSHVNEVHHIWPRGRGGPNVAENRVTVCATGHNNIHQLLNEMLATNGNVPYSVQRMYAFKERELARLGYERIKRGAL